MTRTGRSSGSVKRCGVTSLRPQRGAVQAQPQVLSASLRRKAPFRPVEALSLQAIVT